MNNIDRFFEESNSPAEFAKSYCSYLSELLAGLDYDAIQKVTELILQARDNGKTVYVIGNGGSAATASHIANDFLIGTTRITNKPFKFVALTDNNAVMTCIANDFGYEEVFLRQLKSLMTSGDMLIAISASGNSPNVINCVEYANNMKNETMAFTGFDGGKLAKSAKTVINVGTPKGEYGPVEDIHMVLDHLISSYILRAAKDS